MDLSRLKPMVPLVALLVLAGCASAPKTPNSIQRPAVELASVVGNAEQGAVVQLPAGNSLGVDAVIVDRTYFAASGRECRRLRGVNGEPIQRVACKGRDGEWQFARDLRTASVGGTNITSSLKVESDTVDLNRQVLTERQPLVPSAGSILMLNPDGSVSQPEAAMGAAELDLNPDAAVALGLDAADSNAATFVESENALTSSSLQASSDTLGTSIRRELYANETLWSFARRTTGNALNWQAIANHNGITDAKTLAPGAVLNIPVELVGQGG